ncbi:DUF6300 family protein [Streptomyces sp. NPDC049906]|uniref:DUF6300 family protein n=1 Tax=Streptomyces sp. NPDC049906 TaxID=3155656 RepID=UPI003424544B
MSAEVDPDTVLVDIRDTPPCPTCGGPSEMVARFSCAIVNGRGEWIQGLREALLCAHCDHSDPAAAELLALFAVDDVVSPENLQTFGGLTAAWVESVRHRTVDRALLDQQLEQWHRGEL